MKLRPARLGTGHAHLLQGSVIDRSRPLQFRLDGRVIHGFAGDTVLSAVLASGIDTTGRRGGMAVALTSRHAPAIAAASHAKDLRHALPMEHVLAWGGADYVTLRPRYGHGPLARLLRRDRNSLCLDLDGPDALTRPWLGMASEPAPEADLVVIGGGVAGMSAALAGAKRGLRVVLVEASPRLGGHSRLFGTLDGEETPDQSIARLSTAIKASARITALTSSAVFALRSGKVRLHQILQQDSAPIGRVLDLGARHIVLATGALERLPVFSGNRLPGVIGALEAFNMAQLYGVWPGRSAILATSSSPAYRLAMLTRDAGVDMLRILDSRPQPQSRFIEFSKAYGITQAAGTIAASALPDKKTGGLTVMPQLAMDGFSGAEPPLIADRLIVCGGWQPDLTLWHMAGGESGWNARTARLEAGHAPAGIALAGSAAGWFTRRACLASGGKAVDDLLGNEHSPVEDPLIDPLYETPDGTASLGDLPDDGGHPAYLDGGHGYLARPRPATSHWPAWLPFVAKPATWSLADTPHPLDIAEIAAGVQLGAIPAASAGIVAQERVAMVGMEAANPGAPTPSATGSVPPYLMGRYENARLFVVVPDEQRLLTIGTLIHANPDETDPLRAVGVVVRIVDGTAIALVAGLPGQLVYAREPGRAIAIRLVAPYDETMDLAAALGGGAGPL